MQAISRQEAKLETQLLPQMMKGKKAYTKWEDVLNDLGYDLRDVEQVITYNDSTTINVTPNNIKINLKMQPCIMNRRKSVFKLKLVSSGPPVNALALFRMDQFQYQGQSFTVASSHNLYTQAKIIKGGKCVHEFESQLGEQFDSFYLPSTSIVGGDVVNVNDFLSLSNRLLEKQSYNQVGIADDDDMFTYYYEIPFDVLSVFFQEAHGEYLYLDDKGLVMNLQRIAAALCLQPQLDINPVISSIDMQFEMHYIRLTTEDLISAVKQAQVTIPIINAISLQGALVEQTNQTFSVGAGSRLSAIYDMVVTNTSTGTSADETETVAAYVYTQATNGTIQSLLRSGYYSPQIPYVFVEADIGGQQKRLNEYQIFSETFKDTDQAIKDKWYRQFRYVMKMDLRRFSQDELGAAQALGFNLVWKKQLALNQPIIKGAPGIVAENLPFYTSYTFLETQQLAVYEEGQLRLL